MILQAKQERKKRMEYRGIQLDESVKLYNKDESYNKKTKGALDSLADSLAKKNHVLLSEYKDNRSKVLIDFKCDHEPHLIRPQDYKRGRGCPMCGVFTYTELPSEQAKKKFIEMIRNNNHKLLSEYKNRKEKVLIDFDCGHELHLIRPQDYKRCRGCPMCGKSSSEQTKKEFSKLIKSNGHRLLSEYKSAKEKVLIDFDCDHEPHLIRPNDYKKGHACPKCKESKGEKIIRKWLDENNINHITQYMLPNRNWRYDIYIPSKNLIIEVQGLQHFQFVKYFHKTKENFYKQANDYNKKWGYACNRLGYNYMEVDYREAKPELALERFLEEFNELQAK